MDFEWMFRHHIGRRVDKWRHYFQIYDRHFDRFRGKRIRVLEIGVDHGGSLQIWKKYFGDDALIVGVDIDPRCKAYEEPGVQIEIGDQADPGFWRSLQDHYTGFDIVIDDGSHRIQDQKASFLSLWWQTRSVYLIEDCHQGLPSLHSEVAIPLIYEYPWVVVAEKPQRLIRGEASRELRPDEIQATKEHAVL